MGGTGGGGLAIADRQRRTGKGAAQRGSQLMGKASAELVAAEIEPLQVGQAAPLRRQSSGQVVAEEVQLPQAGESAPFGRQLPGQFVVE